MHSVSLLCVAGFVVLATAQFNCTGSLYNTLGPSGIFDCSKTTLTSGTSWNPRNHLLTPINVTTTQVTVIGYGFAVPFGTHISYRQQLYDSEFELMDTTSCDHNFTTTGYAPSFGTLYAHDDVSEKKVTEAASRPAIDSPLAVTASIILCYPERSIVLNTGEYYLDTYVSIQSTDSGVLRPVDTVQYPDLLGGHGGPGMKTITPSQLSHENPGFPSFLLQQGFLPPTPPPPSPPNYPNGHTCTDSYYCKSTCCCSTAVGTLCADPQGCTDLNGHCQ